jgi:hypothetical protein
MLCKRAGLYLVIGGAADIQTETQLANKRDRIKFLWFVSAFPLQEPATYLRIYDKLL